MKKVRYTVEKPGGTVKHESSRASGWHSYDLHGSRAAGEIYMIAFAGIVTYQLPLVEIERRLNPDTRQRYPRGIYLPDSRIDLTDIPEADEEWFKRARFYPHGR